MLDALQGWIDNNPTRVQDLAGIVVKGGRVDDQALVDHARGSLRDEIARILKSDQYGQVSLAHRLAEAGILPMYGMPTSVRMLYHRLPPARSGMDIPSPDEAIQHSRAGLAAGRIDLPATIL